MFGIEILEKTLKQASYKVWKELAPLKNIQEGWNIFEVREDTLTTMALRAIIKTNSTAITHIFESKKNETGEKLTGLDFELEIWLGKPKERVRFFIQAKKMRNYHSIDGKYDIELDQLEKLEEYAVKEKATPLYALYQNLVGYPNPLHPYYNSITKYDRKALGITLSPSTKIKKMKNESFASIHKYDYSIKDIKKIINKDDNALLDDKLLLALYLTTFPLHELAHLNLSFFEKINTSIKRARKLKSSLNKLNFFFFFPFLNVDDNNDNDVFYIHSLSDEEIVNKLFGVSENNQGDILYSPKTEHVSKYLMIINNSD